MNVQKFSRLFVILAALSAIAMLVANIGAFKQNALWHWSVPGGTAVFIITYVVSDILSEVYGYKASRFVAWLGFALNLFAVLMFQLTIFLPAPEWFEFSGEFALVLGNTPRMVVAGMTAYVLGDWLNDIVFQKMRAKHGVGKKFPLRAIVSSFCGECVDSTVFILIAFTGVMPTSAMFSTIVTLVLLKTAYEAAILPLTTYCTRKVREYEGVAIGER